MNIATRIIIDRNISMMFKGLIIENPEIIHYMIYVISLFVVKVIILRFAIPDHLKDIFNEHQIILRVSSHVQFFWFRRTIP
jgi:hypothetical protein